MQRYKFQQVTSEAFRQPQWGATEELAVKTREILPRPSGIKSCPLLLEFTHILNVNDPRYDICWLYGDILKEVPKLLGSDAALDASVAALVVAHTDFVTRQVASTPTPQYGRALSTLRSSLIGPVEFKPYITICTIYVLWIC